MTPRPPMTTTTMTKHPRGNTTTATTRLFALLDLLAAVGHLLQLGLELVGALLGLPQVLADARVVHRRVKRAQRSLRLLLLVVVAAVVFAVVIGVALVRRVRCGHRDQHKFKNNFDETTKRMWTSIIAHTRT